MRRTHAVTRDGGSPIRTQEYQEANVPILGEVLFAAELVLLHAAPLYYGLGIPHGDGSAVILLPAFLCPDVYLTPLHQWLARIGYKPFFSGIGFNTECPNLLIKQQLNTTIEKALAKSGRKVHLVGHSLGGIIARAIAAQRPSVVFLNNGNCVSVTKQGVTKTTAAVELGVVTTDIHGNGSFKVVVGPIASGTYELEFDAQDGAGCFLIGGNNICAAADFQSPGPKFGDATTITIP